MGAIDDHVSEALAPYRTGRRPGEGPCWARNLAAVANERCGTGGWRGAFGYYRAVLFSAAGA